MENNKHLVERLLPFLLLIVIAIVIAFVAQILLDVRNELKEVKSTLVRIENEKIKSVSFQPFKVLEENCTNCHSDRKFMGIHGTDTEITGIIKFLEKMPDVHLTSEEIDKVHNSLSLLKCVKCHDEQQMQILGTMNTTMQREILERMSKKSSGKILPEEIAQLQRILLKVQGF